MSQHLAHADHRSTVSSEKENKPKVSCSGVIKCVYSIANQDTSVQMQCRIGKEVACYVRDSA